MNIKYTEYLNIQLGKFVEAFNELSENTVNEFARVDSVSFKHVTYAPERIVIYPVFTKEPSAFEEAIAKVLLYAFVADPTHIYDKPYDFELSVSYLETKAIPTGVISALKLN